MAWTSFASSGQATWMSFTRRRIVAGSLDTVVIPGRWLGHNRCWTLSIGG